MYFSNAKFMYRQYWF